MDGFVTKVAHRGKGAAPPPVLLRVAVREVFAAAGYDVAGDARSIWTAMKALRKRVEEERDVWNDEREVWRKKILSMISESAAAFDSPSDAPLIGSECKFLLCDQPPCPDA